MSRLRIVLLVLIIVVCLCLPCVHAEMSSTNYRITSSIISGGGSAVSSTNYHLVSTLGQPSLIGSSSSTGYGIDSGFWYAMQLYAIGDVNGDGLVNLEDVIATLQVVTGQLPVTIIKEADTDGDGEIGLSEAFHILRKLGE